MTFGRKGRSTPLKREPLTDLEDLRDDMVALALDSKLSFQQIHAAGGPTPGTISKWLYRETHFPRLDTMRALCKAVGGNICVVGDKVADQLAGRSQMGRLGLSAPVAPQMDMAAHKKRQKQHRTHRNRSAHRVSART
jgi:hypothetical protein